MKAIKFIIGGLVVMFIMSSCSVQNGLGLHSDKGLYVNNNEVNYVLDNKTGLHY